MSELQAAIEFQVELSKFYNVDLFQRGFYQIRSALKSTPKAPVKIEVSLPKNSECHLVVPAAIVNGVAVSKTFQILYRNEDVSVNDIVLFKANMLVDSHKIEECIDEADFQLILELWFTDEELGPDQQEKLQCISQRSLKLHFSPTKGLHHHVPVLFDYFHLSVICVTLHATLIALHQPYIYLPKQPKAAWTAAKGQDAATLESVLFGSNTGPTMANTQHRVSPRLHQACAAHRKICNMLLSAYESLQTSYESLMARLPTYQQLKIEHKDCHRKLETLSGIAQSFKTEEDLLQAAQSDVAQLCAENVILWMQYLELVSFNEKITHQLAREHHLQRVKRFSECFFTYECPKHAMLDCYDPSVHGHSDLATVVRASEYYQSNPALEVECAELDGDHTSLPIIFEDIFCDVAQPTKKFVTMAEESDHEAGSTRSSGGRDSRSDNSSSASGDSPKFKRSKKLNFIKNMRPETFKRPSYTNPEVAANVAMDKSVCTLVGYRKVHKDTDTTLCELGTLSPVNNRGSLLLQTSAHEQSLYNATSMPTLVGRNHLNVVSSGSMPELCSSVSNKATLTPDLVAMVTSSTNGDSQPGLARNPTLQALAGTRERASTVTGAETSTAAVQDAAADPMTAKTDQGTTSSGSSSPSVSTDAIENGYLPSGEELDKGSGSDDQGAARGGSDAQIVGNVQSVDYNSLADSLSHALGEPEDTADAATGGVQRTDSARSAQSSDSITAIAQSSSCDLGEKASDSGVSSRITTDTPQPTGPSEESSALDTSLDHSASEISLSMTEDEQAEYLKGECTVLELLKEEYERSQGAAGTEPQQQKQQQAVQQTGDCPVSLMEEAMGASKGMPGRAARSHSSAVGIAHYNGNQEAKKQETHRALTQSSSSPELGAVTKPQRLVSPVPDKTISFITAKEKLRRLLRYQGHLYSDFPSQASSVPYFWPTEYPCDSDEGIHLVICVHGLDGNSADLRLVRTYMELALPGAKIDFLMSERNQPDTFADFETMTDRLVQEILGHIELYGVNPARISFVGHSLGNLIIRSALSREKMAPLLPKLYTFLSLSGPHLGTLYNSSGLVNMGMWFMQKWKKSGSLLQLSLKDHTDPRETFLYRLSQKSGLEFFRNVLLVSSIQDRYVPYHSSRIELCKAAVKDSSGSGVIYEEMIKNILQPIVYNSDCNLVRYDIFHALPSSANTVIGRAAHIAVLDSEVFIEKLITVAVLKYFK